MKPANTFRLIAFGDVIGDPGIRALYNVLSEIRKRYMPDAIVVNGENAAQGFGIYRKNVEEMLNHGIDVITGGNHIWQRKETFDFIDEYDALLRPLNYPPATPGHGSVIMTAGGVKYAVINAIGRIFMDPMDCPFRTVEKEVEAIRAKGVKLIFIDFHAEATSEKQLFGRYFDGKVSGIWGTHTHVMTADETILPGKTAYISDIGKCGCVESILGMKYEEAKRRVIDLLPARFSPADRGPLEVNGVVIDVDVETGQAKLINRILEGAGVVQQR